jgi:hypothetical protein
MVVLSAGGSASQQPHVIALIISASYDGPPTRGCRMARVRNIGAC